MFTAKKVISTSATALLALGAVSGLATPANATSEATNSDTQTTQQESSAYTVTATEDALHIHLNDTSKFVVDDSGAVSVVDAEGNSSKLEENLGTEGESLKATYTVEDEKNVSVILSSGDSSDVAFRSACSTEYLNALGEGAAGGALTGGASGAVAGGVGAVPGAAAGAVTGSIVGTLVHAGNNLIQKGGVC